MSTREEQVAATVRALLGAAELRDSVFVVVVAPNTTTEDTGEPANTPLSEPPEETIEAGTTVIDGIYKAYEALTAVNNGKRNRLLCQAAESALHRAMAALQKMAPDGN